LLSRRKGKKDQTTTTTTTTTTKQIVMCSVTSAKQKTKRKNPSARPLPQDSLTFPTTGPIKPF
jgi:hypothetical protein